MKFQPADIPAQIRRMGREDNLAGKTECPFAAKSNAAKLWKEGYGMKLKILETGKKLRSGVELVDLFDTRGQRNPIEWELVAAKVRRPDAEYLVDAVEAAQSIAEAQADPAYLEKFPLDTPGRFYDAIADRIRAAESEDTVLADVGLCRLADQQGRVAEAARRYVEATAGLENTEEGRALLAAIGRG